MINEIIGVDFDKDGILQFLDSVKAQQDCCKTNPLRKTHKFSLRIENENGVYTIEPKSPTENIFQVFEQAIEPALLMMGYTHEHLADYYGEMAMLNGDKPND